MIELSYRRETLPELRGWESRRDPCDATRGELLWYFFPVDIVMRSEGQVVETRHAGVPLLHFALAMIRIAKELSSAGDGEARNVLTESDERVHFTRRGDVVEIRSSFDGKVLKSSIAELRDAVLDLVLAVVEELTTEHPSLAKSPIVNELAAGIQSI
jgi:hypothetical protein